MEVKKYFKVWLLGLKNGLMRRMAFKENFVFLGLAIIMQMILIMAFTKIIFGFFDDIAGWTFEQVMMIISSYVIIEGLLWATCGYLSGIDEYIERGRMDQLLVKPLDIQFSVSTLRSDPEDWIRVITGLIILVISVKNLNIHELWLNMTFYFMTIISSFIIIYSFLLTIKTLLFWLINAHSLQYLGENIVRMSQYPTDIFFHKFVRIFFSTVIPLAFIATVPAKILIHGPKLDLIFYSCLLAFVFFVGSRKFFLYGLKHYSSASS